METTIRNIIFYIAIIGFYYSNAQIVNQDAFLKGNYIEVGVSSCGSYGTIDSAPVGYHPRNNSANTRSMGFVSDPAKDGWTVGAPNYCGDYFLPGTPAEGWGVEIDGESFINTNASSSSGGGFGGICGKQDIPGSIIKYDDTSTVGLICVIWQGRINGMIITQRTCLQVDSLFFTTELQFCNDTTIPLTDLYYARNLDPDNDVMLSNNYKTINEVISQPSNNSSDALVTAKGTVHQSCFLGLGARDGRARVTHGGFLISSSISDYFFGSVPYLQSGIETADEAISIGFSLGNLDTGQCVCFSFAYILNINQLGSALNATSSVDIFADTINISANPSTVVCTGQDTVSLSLVSTSSVNWKWSPSIGLSDTIGDTVKAFPSTTTVYTVVGTGNFGLCDEFVRQITVYVDSIPLKLLDTVICKNIEYPIILINPILGAEYIWHPGTGLSDSTIYNPVILLDTSRSYLVIGTTDKGCIDSNIINVKVDSSIFIDAGEDLYLCENEKAIIGGSPTVMGDIDVLWSASGILGFSIDILRLSNIAAENPEYDPSKGKLLGFFYIAPPDTIKYIVTEQKCGFSDTMLLITLRQDASIDGLRSFYCPASPIDTAVLIPKNGQLSGMGIIMDSILDPSISPIGGPYKLTYIFTDTSSNDSVCYFRDSIYYSIIKLDTALISGIDSEYCFEDISDQIILSPLGGVLSGQGIVAGKFDPKVAGVGMDTIIYEYTNTQSMCKAIDSFITTVYPNPQVNFDIQDYTCDSIAVVRLTSNIEEGMLYNWSFDNGTLIADSGAQIYLLSWDSRGLKILSLSSIDSNGCNSSVIFDSIYVVNLTAQAFSDTTIYLFTEAMLGVNHLPLDNMTYQWNPSEEINCIDCQNIIVKPEDTTLFIVRVEHSPSGCEVYDTVLVKVDKTIIFEIPKAFSPNGDGVNDYFQIIQNALLFEVDFSIFNRWGEEVFYTNNLFDKWDGNYENQPQPVGIYNYRIKVNNFNGDLLEKKGVLTLIR